MDNPVTPTVVHCRSTTPDDCGVEEARGCVGIVIPDSLPRNTFIRG